MDSIKSSIATTTTTSTTTTTTTMPQIFVLKSIFEYLENGDAKILKFNLDERFVMIKDPDKSSDWYYVINENGQIGYVPNSYVIYEENLNIKELLQLIDSIALKLDQKKSEQNKILTDRQLKHAQIKLAQMRCEINETIIKMEQLSLTKPIGSLLSNVNELSVIQEENKEDDDSNNNHNNDNGEKCLKKCNHCCNNNKQQIDEQLIINLIENLKLDININESKAINIINSVIKTFLEYIPMWKIDLNNILFIMDKYLNEKLNVENIYSSKLKCIFKRLHFYKNDQQQLNWPIDQDEDIIKSYLDELIQLLLNTEQCYLQNEICYNNNDNIINLIQYFQMETRRTIRLKLIDIFIYLILLYYNNISPEFYLTTILPNELAMEMKNYVSDKQRWIKSSILFTLIFSSGHRPPISIYESINETFFQNQFNLCEGYDIDGKPIDNFDIPSENIISPILSFNLHFNNNNNSNLNNNLNETNVIFKALSKRTNVSHFTENLISYLNWEEDIIITIIYNNIYQQYEQLQNQQILMLKNLNNNNNNRDNNNNNGDNSQNNQNDSIINNKNSVLKFLIEMFADKIVSKLFYYNDVRVIIDIIISQLNNLPVGDNRIKYYLELTGNILKNTQYAEEPHKSYELKKCLISIINHEFSNNNDVQLAQQIIECNNDAFDYPNQ